MKATIEIIILIAGIISFIMLGTSPQVETILEHKKQKIEQVEKEVPQPKRGKLISKS